MGSLVDGQDLQPLSPRVCFFHSGAACQHAQNVTEKCGSDTLIEQRSSSTSIVDRMIFPQLR